MVFPLISSTNLRRCGLAIERQFSEKRGSKVRMSGVGKPLCQQKLSARDDIEEDVDYTCYEVSVWRHHRSYAVTVMKAAGVNIQSEQEGVSQR